MVVDVLVLCFLASFIPAVRENFKKGLNKLFIIMGIGLLVVNSIMSFLTFPKLVNLSHELNVPLDIQKLQINLGIGFLLSLVLFLIGWKYKNMTKSNLRFYLMFGLLVIITGIVIQMMVVSVIQPIYKLTSSL